MITAEKIAIEMRKGILKWYDFKNHTVALCISENNNFGEMLLEKGVCATHTTVRGSAETEFLKNNRHSFDYVIVIGMLETCFEPIKMLERWKSVLKENGKLLLGVENRLGLRYFCGDRDPFTKRNFDGIENYRRQDHSNIKSMGGRCYARFEIEAMLDKAGFHSRKFYSVLPDLEQTQLIYAEDYLPNEELAMRYTPMYHYPDAVFLHEGLLYKSIIQNGMFHQMANAYLIECSEAGEFVDVRHVTLSMDRGPEQAFATIIRTDNKVEKRPLYPQGINKLKQLQESAEDLKAHGIPVVDAQLVDDAYIMPYVESPIGNSYMQDLLLHNKEEFIRKMDQLRDLILKSSEHVEQNELGIILKKGYIDLVSLNCFYKDGEFVFYDQEFYEENYPANAIIYRTVSIIYANDVTRESILPSSFFWERYGMGDKLALWHEMTTKFTDTLHRKKEIMPIHDAYGKTWQIVNHNKLRINDGKDFYRKKYLETCFQNMCDKKIYVFGAGKFANKFLAFYKDDYSVCNVLDNNSAKQGLEIRGIKIEAPRVLTGLDPKTYKVIVCIKNYEPIIKQLMRMGVQNIGIYDANHIYPGRQQELPQAETEAKKQKKYHIGYIAGVFDLYHIGHLNMFKRAKEQCDYLIAAVVSDDGVRNNKKREPYIPFEERIEMVRSCKYVDEAVEIPYLYGGTIDAYQKYHFDCQFSGSDYIDDPWWLKQKQYLEEHGAELVFFPYTQQTSSTKIKGLIDKGLL